MLLTAGRAVVIMDRCQEMTALSTAIGDQRLMGLSSIVSRSA